MESSTAHHMNSRPREEIKFMLKLSNEHSESQFSHIVRHARSEVVNSMTTASTASVAAKGYESVAPVSTTSPLILSNCSQAPVGRVSPTLVGQPSLSAPTGQSNVIPTIQQLLT